MLLSFVATIIVIIILRMPISPTFFLFLIPMFYIFVFTLGLSLFLASSNVFFRDIEHLYGVFTTAWMYITPIFYPMDILPDFMINVLKLNPLYHYILYFRALVMYNHIPDLHSNLVCMEFSILMLITGIIFFKKKQDKFILYI